MQLFENEKIWRLLSNFWTIALLVFLVADFLTKSHYSFLTPTFSIIYTGILSLYVGTKEFNRWYVEHESRHPGEWFIILWTAVFALMLIVSLVEGSDYHISPEAVADYIMVLSIFAVTQNSKKLHRRHRKTK